MSRVKLYLLAVLVVMVAGLLIRFNTPGAGDTATRPAFTLNDAQGPVSLSDFKGQVVLVYFGYTFCPDVCPTGLAALALGLKQLSPAERGQVATVFVSVDPERDTVARLKEYTAFFDPAFRGLTGAPAQVAEAARQFGAFYAKQPSDGAAGYLVDHTADAYVVDRQGRLVGKIPHDMAPEALAAELRRYL